MPVIAVLPYFGFAFMYPHAVLFANYAMLLSLLLVLLASGVGIALSKRWAVWATTAGIVLIGILYVQDSVWTPRRDAPSSHDTVTREDVSQDSSGDVTYAVTVVVNDYLSPRPYLLALFVIALIHTLRDRLIAWWLGRRVAGASPQVL